MDDAAAALPRKAKDAIALGLQAFAEKEYEAAADLFQLSLTLPGSGAARRAGSPTEFAVPSDGGAPDLLDVALLLAHVLTHAPPVSRPQRRRAPSTTWPAASLHRAA